MTSWMKWVAAPVAAMTFVLAGAAMTARAEEGAGAKGTISATVVDSNGGKIAGATVRVVAAREKGAKQTALSFEVVEMGDAEGGKKKEGGAKKGMAAAAEGTTDNDGKFSAEVPAGKYRVMAMSKTAGKGSAPVTVESGQSADVTITLSADAGKDK